jgi:hypothetical protein
MSTRAISESGADWCDTTRAAAGDGAGIGSPDAVGSTASPVTAMPLARSVALSIRTK